MSSRDNLVIIPAKGCVHFVRRDSTAGFYSLRPPLAGTEEAPIILDGAEYTTRDNLFAVSTLDKSQFVYTFGKDFGDYVISGRVLLGKSDSGKTGLTPLISWFEANRVSNNSQLVALQYPSAQSVNLIVNALSIGRPDPEFNIQMFAIRGILVEPP